MSGQKFYVVVSKRPTGGYWFVSDHNIALTPHMEMALVLSEEGAKKLANECDPYFKPYIIPHELMSKDYETWGDDWPKTNHMLKHAITRKGVKAKPAPKRDPKTYSGPWVFASLDTHGSAIIKFWRPGGAGYTNHPGIDGWSITNPDYQVKHLTKDILVPLELVEKFYLNIPKMPTYGKPYYGKLRAKDLGYYFPPAVPNLQMVWNALLAAAYPGGPTNLPSPQRAGYPHKPTNKPNV